MALTFEKLNPDPSHVSGNVKTRYRKVTFDSAYPDGGEPVTAADFGLTHLYFVEVLSGLIKSDEESVYLVSFDDDANTLLVHEGDNNNAADAPFVEVDTTNPDLSTFRVYVKGIGI